MSKIHLSKEVLLILTFSRIICFIDLMISLKPLDCTYTGDEIALYLVYNIIGFKDALYDKIALIILFPILDIYLNINI